MSAATAWRQARHLRTRGQVGEFFNYLGAKIVRGRVIGHVHDGNSPEFGDVVNDELGLQVEVKGSGNFHSWRLNKSQMDYPSTSIFSVYMLGSYKNRGKEKGSKKVYSMLARIYLKNEKFRFLTRKTDEVYLLDVSFVRALEDAGVGKHLASGFGDGEPTYQLTRTDIRQFQEPSCEVLAELGVAGEWVFRRYKFEVNFSIPSVPGISYYASFPLYTALGADLDRLLDPVIQFTNDFGMPY